MNNVKKEWKKVKKKWKTLIFFLIQNNYISPNGLHSYHMGEGFFRVFIPRFTLTVNHIRDLGGSSSHPTYWQIICDEKYEVFINTALFKVIDERERSIM